MFLIALGEHIFLLGLQHRIFLDFSEIAVEALLSAQRRNCETFALCHFGPLPFFVDHLYAGPLMGIWRGAATIRFPVTLLYKMKPPCGCISSIKTTKLVDQFPYISR